MDPLYLALSSYRKRKFAICADICTEILQEDACQRAAWLLKMRALTQQVFYDDLEIIEGLVDGGNEAVEATLMTTTAKPGTSINKCPTTASTNRPRTQGRAISGVVRFNQLTTASNEATKTARIETASRLSRLGTASMLPHSRDFINVSRLNLPTYAAMKDTAKILFEYLYFVEGDMKKVINIWLSHFIQKYFTFLRWIGTWTGGWIYPNDEWRWILLEMRHKPLPDQTRTGAASNTREQRLVHQNESTRWHPIDGQSAPNHRSTFSSNRHLSKRNVNILQGNSPPHRHSKVRHRRPRNSHWL